MSAFDGVVVTKRTPRTCTKCGEMSRDWEGHHVVYYRGAPTLPLCFRCHQGITDLNTLAADALGRTVKDQERKWLWNLFLGEPIKKGSLAEKRCWMAELVKEQGWRPALDFVPNAVWWGTQSTLHLNY